MQRACRSPEKYHDIVLSTQKATCRYQGHLMTVNNALISYRFLNGERETEPSPKNRICPNVRNERKQSIMAGKTSKLAVHEVAEKRGGIFNASSASEIPKTNQAYRISKITRKASDDPLQQLIESSIGMVELGTQ